MANPNPVCKIQKGYVNNPLGINAHTPVGRSRQFNARINELCMDKAEAIIERWIDAALNADLRIAIHYGRDILDRALGKVRQQMVIETEDGKPQSTQRTWEMLEKAIAAEEQANTLKSEVQELKAQIALLLKEREKCEKVIEYIAPMVEHVEDKKE